MAFPLGLLLLLLPAERRVGAAARAPSGPVRARQGYEKVEQGYAWAQSESLVELERPERRERERIERLAARRRARYLAQVFGFSEPDAAEPPGHGV